jgi:NADH-quinone oxidoreductase subunit K
MALLALLAAGALFLVGFVALLVRTSLLVQILALEVMMAGAALALVAGPVLGAGDPVEGEAMVVLVLAVAAAEAALGLALLLRLGSRPGADDTDMLDTLRD